MKNMPEYLTSIFSLVPGGSKIVNIQKAIQGIEVANFDAQAKTFYNILSNGGTRDESVHELIKSKLGDKSDEFDYYITYILLQLTRNTETKQTEVETRAFRDFLDGNVEWDEFTLYCNIVGRMIPMDFEALKELRRNGGKIAIDGDQMSDRQKIEYGRLEGMGLLSNSYNPPSLFQVDVEGKGIMPAADDERKKENNYSLTKIGREIGKYLIGDKGDGYAGTR